MNNRQINYQSGIITFQVGQKCRYNGEEVLVVEAEINGYSRVRGGLVPVVRLNTANNNPPLWVSGYELDPLVKHKTRTHHQP